MGTFKAKDKTIWVTWEHQRRNISLSERLNIKLYEFDLKGPRCLRYPVLIFRTVYLLIIKRPRTLFVENPSIVLALLAVIYKKITRAKAVVDAHNSVIDHLNSREPLLTNLTKYIIRNTDLTIVTNSNLKNEIEKYSGKGFVLPDPIPHFPKIEPIRLKGRYNILYISSFGEDEPIEEVIGAAKRLDKNIFIYITGNYRRYLQKLPEKIPTNVIFTGYLPEEKYIQMLHSVDLIMDLTKSEDCLVCGMYEALAVEKSLILSDKKALRDYFNSGAVFTANTPSDIARSINTVLKKKKTICKEIAYIKTIKQKMWEADFKKLLLRLTISS